MNSRTPSLFLMIAALAVGACGGSSQKPEPASAPGSASAVTAVSNGGRVWPFSSDDEIERAKREGHAIKWNVVPPGETESYGRAIALIRAPIATVRPEVLNYSQYKDFAPARFKQSRIVGKDAKG